jgi:hypothetical protein
MSIYTRKSFTSNLWPTYINIYPSPSSHTVKIQVSTPQEATTIKDAFIAVCQVMQIGEVESVYCTPYFKFLDMHHLDASEQEYIMTIRWRPFGTQEVNVESDPVD